MSQRTFLNRHRTFLGTDAAYLTRDGVEMDSGQAYEVTRRRVFFDDVNLVTLHHERGWAFIGVAGAFGTFLVALAIFIVAINVNGWPWALPFFLVGLPALIGALVRLAMGRSVVTVFGRRTRAVIRFGVFKTNRAAEVYRILCATAGRAQRRIVNVPESPAPPLPADVPLPPLER
ncbi:MAG TPA: hypothetical protein VM733_03300 [Thermoanaerobaculia bacterium]|nr:hypothetical protein [Thermoanaerobaculia bacterium]